MNLARFTPGLFRLSFVGKTLITGVIYMTRLFVAEVAMDYSYAMSRAISSGVDPRKYLSVPVSRNLSNIDS